MTQSVQIMTKRVSWGRIPWRERIPRRRSPWRRWGIPRRRRPTRSRTPWRRWLGTPTGPSTTTISREIGRRNTLHLQQRQEEYATFHQPMGIVLGSKQ